MHSYLPGCISGCQELLKGTAARRERCAERPNKLLMGHNEAAPGPNGGPEGHLRTTFNPQRYRGFIYWLIHKGRCFYSANAGSGFSGSTLSTLPRATISTPPWIVVLLLRPLWCVPFKSEFQVRNDVAIRVANVPLVSGKSETDACFVVVSIPYVTAQ